MPITPDQAAEIAIRHGLSLVDAAGLVTLADTVEEGDHFARKFAQASDPTTGEKVELAKLTNRLFNRKATLVPEESDPSRGPLVPGEGAVLDLGHNDERERRQFVADLFRSPDRDHI